MQDDRPPGRRQLDDVLDAMLPFAHQMLDKHGEFFPFGAAMRRDGKVNMVAGDAENEHPASEQIMDVIRRGMRRRHEEYLAVGVCYDVRVRPNAEAQPTDAICISLEHRDGTAVDVFEPYTKHRSTIDYGPLFAQPGRKTVFED